MKQLALALAVTFALSACTQSSDAPVVQAAPEAAAPQDQPTEVAPPRSSAELFTDKLDGILAGDWRSAANKARDSSRHPQQTLAFFELEPGQTVIEIAPGAGWYTEILAPALKDNGHLIAAVAADASSDYAAKSNEKYRALLAENVAHFGEIKLLQFDPAAPVLGPAGSADRVLTFRNVHNWTAAGNAEKMFKAFNEVLKPGGVLGVVEHRAAAGTDSEALKKSGYVAQDQVIQMATDAGFELAGESEINANPNDTKDYEKGVWTLPPTLAMGDTDREKYGAIGESDRMTLKFIKPKSDDIFSQGTDAKRAPAD